MPGDRDEKLFVACQSDFRIGFVLRRLENLPDPADRLAPAEMRHTDERVVDLFYSTKAPDQVFIGAVEQLAKRANVRLHILVSGKDERLTAKRLCEIVPEWMSADVWFCGPAGFGRALRRDLAARGLAVEDFHQELFEMR
jgi:predicted ferric reductase